jgi:hypothetical protein
MIHCCCLKKRRLSVASWKNHFHALGHFVGHDGLPLFADWVWQFDNVRRDAPRFIKSQSLGGDGIARITMAVDVTEALAVRVHDFEAAV